MSAHSTDGRQADKSLEDEAKGLVARSAREGTPLMEMKLRETGIAKNNIVGLAREEFARLAGTPLIQFMAEANSEVSVIEVHNQIADLASAAMASARVKAAEMRGSEAGRLHIMGKAGGLS